MKKLTRILMTTMKFSMTRSL